MTDQNVKLKVVNDQVVEGSTLIEPEYWEHHRYREEVVIEAYMRGVRKAELISAATDVPLPVVRAIISKAKLRERANRVEEEVKREVLEGKVPVLKEIVDLSLTNLRDFLKTPQAKPANLSEGRQLAAIGKELNEILRLEVGKSTINIADATGGMTLERTTELLAELRDIDPIFEYPQLNGAETEVLPPVEKKDEDPLI